MERKTISLISKKGQIFLEGLFFICCLLGFLLTLNLFQQHANKEIKKHRLNKPYKKRFHKNRWYSNSKKLKSNL